MSQNENKHLLQTLVDFGVPSLGEGDANAGTNTLAAMSFTLANLARSGSGIASPGLGKMRAGGSLLVHGSLSASLIRDDITAEVATKQNNLAAQLRRLVGDKMADARKKGLTAIEFPVGPEANSAENALFQLEQKNPLVPVEPLEMWEEVLDSPPNPRIEDLVARPKILVTTTCAADLQKQLCGLHGGHPLVVLGLNRPADAAALGDICPALLEGLLPDGTGGETIDGNLLVTDPSGVLEEVVRGGGDRTRWLGRMLWLVDGDAGPDLNVSPSWKVTAGRPPMAWRFRDALSRVIGARINNHDQRTTLHEFDLDESQIRWVEFLKGMESEIPGISGTARGLLATLTFGLLELGRGDRRVHPEPIERLSVTAEGVEAVGKHLILRMAKARTAMLWTAQRERLSKIGHKIYVRIDDSLLPMRDIYRPLNLTAGVCEELLMAMEGVGVLRSVGQKWGRVQGAKYSDEFLNRMHLAG